MFIGDACDSGDYAGCIIWEGEHAGQVAVWIEENYSACSSCDRCLGDTYYGCVNWATGQFEVEIPECCITTPANLDVTFTGLSNCGCNAYYNYSTVGVAEAINGNTYRLAYQGSSSCRWEYNASGSFGYCRGWYQSNCTGDYDDLPWITMDIRVQGGYAYIEVFGWLNLNGYSRSFFYGSGEADEDPTKCIEASAIANTLECGGIEATDECETVEGGSCQVVQV